MLNKKENCTSLKKWNRVTIVILLLVFVGALCNVCESAAKATSQEYFAAIKKYAQESQYNQLNKVTEQWVAMPNADLALMSKACNFLRWNKLYKPIIILLKRLNWQMPHGYCPNETLHYMKQKGMDKEIDKLLISGTALAGDKINQHNTHGQWVTVVQPSNAQSLFYFYENDKKQLKKLFARYSRELDKRPEDVGLITEYAYWLARYKNIDKAVALLERIDLTKLDCLTLCALGNMWGALDYYDIRLVKFNIKPLKHALTLKMTNKEAMRYTSGWQMMVSFSLAKRLFKERLLTGLAIRYVRVRQYVDAKKVYEQYLALPRRKRWGDRTRVQKKYGEVLRQLNLPDKNLIEMANKAKQSGNGKDWAEFAAYLQGQSKISQAEEAWNRAIALTPAEPRGFKVEYQRKAYRRQLIRMLDDNKMYKKELIILEESFFEEPWSQDYSKVKLLENITKTYLKLGKKAEAMKFLLKQLNKHFDIKIVYLIIRTEHGKSLKFFMSHSSIEHEEASKLSSWTVVLKKIKDLKEPQRSHALAGFYSRYGLYEEYINLVEQLPRDMIDWNKLSRMTGYCANIKRYDKAVHWGKAILKHVGTKDFPKKGSSEYVNVLQHISEYAAKAGDFDTSLEYAKKICLFIPEQFYFVKSLSKLAKTQGKQDELVSQLKLFAQQLPERWVIWKVIAEIYEVFDDNENRKLSIQKMNSLK